MLLASFQRPNSFILDASEQQWWLALVVSNAAFILPSRHGSNSFTFFFELGTFRPDEPMNKKIPLDFLIKIPNWKMTASITKIWKIWHEIEHALRETSTIITYVCRKSTRSMFNFVQYRAKSSGHVIQLGKKLSWLFKEVRRSIIALFHWLKESEFSKMSEMLLPNSYVRFTFQLFTYWRLIPQKLSEGIVSTVLTS